MVARIVLLEDDPDLRAVLSELLSDEGYEVAHVRDLEEIHGAVTAGDVDLVLADAWGPSWEHLGEQEYAEILALGNRVPLLMLTGREWAGGPLPEDMDHIVVMRMPADIDLLLQDVRLQIRNGQDDALLAAAHKAARQLVKAKQIAQGCVVLAAPLG